MVRPLAWLLKRIKTTNTAATPARLVASAPPPLPPRDEPIRVPSPATLSTLHRTPIYSLSAPLPPPLREYQAVEDMTLGICVNGRLGGAIELYRRLEADDLKQKLLASYHRLLRHMIDSGLPGVPPLRIDFHALPVGARPYLVAPYIGCLIGHAYPRLCWQSSDIVGGRLVYIVTGGAADPEPFRQNLGKISAWLGGHWTLGEVTSNTLTLVRREPLPQTIPFQRAMLQRGQLFLGIRTDTHAPLYLPFSEMTSGTFICGASGFGKSVYLHTLLRSIFANLDQFEAVFLVDGKDAVAFHRYSHLHPKIRIIWEDDALYRTVAELVQVMRARNLRQRETGIDNAKGNYIAIIIDEMATFAVKPSVDSKSPLNKAHAAFIDDLTKLAMRGRSTGLRLIISAQSPVAEQVPVPVRSNCQTIISFRTPIDAHATALFGQLENLPADPRKLLKGHALISNGATGTIHPVQVPIAPLMKPGGRP